MKYPWAVPGRKVVCVKVGDWTDTSGLPCNDGLMYPVNGETYTIRDVFLGKCGELYIRVNEIVNPLGMYRDGRSEIKFWIERFRPLHTIETDVALFAELLTPAPNEPMLPTNTNLEPTGT